MTSSLNKLFGVFFFMLLLVASVLTAGCIDINDINIFDDDDDDEDDKKEKKEEKDESPIVVFEPSKWQAEVGTTIVFNASATEARNGNITYYQWNFGDNVYEEGEDVTEVNHSYAAGGTFNVSLTVLDSNNMTNTSWLFIGVYEHITDNGRVSSSGFWDDDQSHEHQVSNDTMWVFYHIELDNPFEDPRTADCTLNLAIAGVEYWSQTVAVTNADPETIEFNVTVHVGNASGGGNESENWTHHIGGYEFTITADSGTVDWDLFIMKGFRYGKPEE